MDEIREEIDRLAAKCELERFVAWEHPEPAEGLFDGEWMEIEEE